MGIETEIICETAEGRKSLLGALMALGYQWHGDCSYTPDSVDQEYAFCVYPVVLIGGKNRLSGSRKPTGGEKLSWPEDAPKILNSLKVRIAVEEVAGYTAVIDKKGIHVGCQTVSFDKFDEIKEAVARYHGRG